MVRSPSEHELPTGPETAPVPALQKAAPPASVMRARYGGVFRRFFEVLFGPITYPDHAAKRIRELAQRGVVVYVSRAPSFLLSLYFNYALSRLGLPLPRFVGGLSLWLWQPIENLWRLLKQRGRQPAGPWRDRYSNVEPTRSEAMLAENTAEGRSAFLFLAQERGRSGGQKRTPHDYVRALVAVQRSTDRPIFIVPHVLTDRAQAASAKGSLRARLVGRRKGRPGRVFAMLVSNRRHATVRVAEAVDLARFVREHPESDDALVARKVRHELDRRTRTEERIIAGPEVLGAEALARHVMRNPRLRATVEAEVSEQGRSEGQVWRQAERYLREIAADYRVGTLRRMDHLMQWVFNRIYDGIVVDEPGLARAIEGSRGGTLVFCPSHRSHVDYLVLSSVLWQYGVMPPHIAAGANLSFWPLGNLFRRCGAFFLRRSFRDNPLYGAVFRAYVAELLRHNTPLEFFPEGTRSRTGKLLMPRFGLFGMVTDAWRRGWVDDVRFVPVSIDYERIIEAGSYERELRGEDKRPEDLSQLLQTTRVLRSRYGRVLVQFGEPISLHTVAARQKLPQSDDIAHDEAWRIEVARLGYRVLHQVAESISVLPTSVVATVLLAHHGRGLAQRRLVELAHASVDFLDTAGARLSEALFHNETREAAFVEAVQRLVDDGLVTAERVGRNDAEPIYHVAEDTRIRLDYFKNNLMNYFAPAAIVCRVLHRHRDRGSLDYSQLQSETFFLSRLFKREFIFKVDTAFDSHFDETMATLAVRGMLDVHEDGHVTLRDPDTVRVLAGLLDSFIEAYWTCALSLKDLRSFPMWDKELHGRALDQARRAFLEGEIRRPEAANRTLVGTALRWFEEEGVIQTYRDGKRRSLRLSPEYEEEGLERLIDEIAVFL